jgi:hypothetical protein
MEKLQQVKVPATAFKSYLCLLRIYLITLTFDLEVPIHSSSNDIFSCLFVGTAVGVH